MGADRSRIERELSLLQGISHAQVPRIYGSYVAEVEGLQLLHVVQELIEGQTLKDALRGRQFGPLPPCRQSCRLYPPTVPTSAITQAANPAILRITLRGVYVAIALVVRF